MRQRSFGPPALALGFAFPFASAALACLGVADDASGAVAAFLGGAP